jgi:hypothetical protein
VAQVLGHGQVIDLVIPLMELHHGREHQAVLLAVEVLGPQVDLDQKRVQVPFVQEDGAEYGLLRLQVVRRDGDALDSAHRDVESRFGEDGTKAMTPLAP